MKFHINGFKSGDAIYVASDDEARAIGHDALWMDEKKDRPRRSLFTKKRTASAILFISNLAEWTGLEPATPGVTGRYSNQLNYHSTDCN
jgi:hypothetical protein